ncbi:hypothetical protein QEH42_gp066 [Microbacterium phage Pumpernickel]|uniref:Uncharacterized protein n=1 Tax=Microbacterium phage Pumpernickel TaxID=2885983 RepID=A0AAE9C2T6_9CAUD|nr:hypothetical protein QEH42_gp066 [Microbacterium phage Pumpernickel]UDL15857.1 hypothetical protein SEA_PUMPERNICKEL_66 [Microbacterium phage Pumpernickel]
MKFTKRTYRVALKINNDLFWTTVGYALKAVLAGASVELYERIERLQREDRLIRARAVREGIKL